MNKRVLLLSLTIIRFLRGTIPESINIPFQTAFGPEGDLVVTPAVQTLNSYKLQVKVVLGSRGKNAVHVSYDEVHIMF